MFLVHICVTLSYVTVKEVLSASLHVMMYKVVLAYLLMVNKKT